MVTARLLLCAVSAAALTHAATYEIAEPDMLAEMQRKAEDAKPRIEAMIEEQKRKIGSLSGVALTPSRKSYVYYIDPTYTLEHDIVKVDRFGNVAGVLYPKGYSFNPIAYTPVDPPPMVVFNACRKRDVSVVKKILAREGDAMLVNSGCRLDDVVRYGAQKLGKVYLLNEKIADRFRLEHTVSLVSVDRKSERIRVEVYKTAD